MNNYDSTVLEAIKEALKNPQHINFEEIIIDKLTEKHYCRYDLLKNEIFKLHPYPMTEVCFDMALISLINKSLVSLTTPITKFSLVSLNN